MTAEERFYNYISFGTNSDEDSTSVPSTASQLRLGQHIADELKAIGIENARMDEYGYVYAFIPASKDREHELPLGFIAHMDTSPDAPGDNIRARTIKYEGGDIELSDGITMREADFSVLERYKGQRLIVTDGKTLLGADDKAGIAEIVTAAEYVVSHPELSHRAMAICFTTDEEINRGTDYFDKEKFGARFAYTLDGGTMGGIEAENFNAAGVDVTVHGVSIHPGSAKNKMKNAVLLASEFISRLPAAESPAHTEDHEGFYHVNSVEGSVGEAHIHILIRDFYSDGFAKRKSFILELASHLNRVYGENTFETVIEDSYYNMYEVIKPFDRLITDAEDAMRSLGIEPYLCPIRGGTDGAKLSYDGIPCPNLPTGGENFHGVYEFVSADAMEQMVQVIIKLIG